jgi:hypothetical protein
METVAEKTPPGWLEILEAGEAELAAGQTVPGEVVHRELQESIGATRECYTRIARRQCEKEASSSFLKKRTKKLLSV